MKICDVFAIALDIKEKQDVLIALRAAMRDANSKFRSSESQACQINCSNLDYELAVTIDELMHELIKLEDVNSAVNGD
ncbi:hypothetical protein [Brumicola nitratireducens]|uniref:Uncharacterized protein n=1 Tax=Glaciecola nitratireducens (strain JCM 12485 / KCTC 12276 / FR1064) TaxID=1085623 RepID=G4QH94_GLANF|nr:hypothetical protein [Glaciecola nitratireducens]AEP29725.1 hypothetical protein GNIT_1608 [Glaciecola nitratireducens FR1064]